ncbi:hypothetical protein ABG067_009359, partial [Albugo candida]
MPEQETNDWNSITFYDPDTEVYYDPNDNLKEVLENSPSRLYKTFLVGRIIPPTVNDNQLPAAPDNQEQEQAQQAQQSQAQQQQEQEQAQHAQQAQAQQQQGQEQ